MSHSRDELKELLPIMQAFVAGKQIQALLSRATLNGIITEWQDVDSISELIPANHYRIKPEPEYRAYSSVSEVPIGNIVIEKTTGNRGLITGAKKNCNGVLKVYVGGHNDIMAQDLFVFWQFANGKPCGVLS